MFNNQHTAVRDFVDGNRAAQCLYRHQIEALKAVHRQINDPIQPEGSTLWNSQTLFSIEII